MSIDSGKYRKRFLYWYLMLSMVAVGTFALAKAGIFETVLHADVTFLSFAIFGLFLVFSLRTGAHTWKIRKVSTRLEGEKLLGKLDLSWFVSDILLSLGMLGTVIGFIYMLGVNFSSLDPGNVALLKSALKSMSIGMSTALWTTASGLICSIILKAQLFNVTEALEELLELKC